MVSVKLYPGIVCVALLLDLFVLCVAYLTVFVNSLVRQFVICVGVVAVWLLLFGCRMLWKCFVWVEVLCWIDRICTCCACDLSVHLSVPSIGFVYVFVCRKVSPRLRV